MNLQKINRTKIIFQNIFIVFFILVIALSAVSYLLSRFYFNDLVKEKIIKNFNTVNKNKYSLSISILNTNLLRAYVLMKEVRITRVGDFTSEKYLFLDNIELPVVELNQVSLVDLIKDQDFNISQFLILNSEMNFVFNKKGSIPLPDILPRRTILENIYVDFFIVNNAKISIKTLNDSILYSAHRFNTELKKVKINTSIEESIRYFENHSDLKSIINSIEKCNIDTR